MFKKITITALLVSALTSTLFAGGNTAPQEAEVAPIPVLFPIPYIGVGAALTGLSRDCPCDGNARLKDLTYGGMTRIGMDFTSWFGIEGRYINTPLDDNFSKVEHYGVYAKPFVSLSGSINAYALAGYGKTKISYKSGGRSSELSKNGFSYGAGMEYLPSNWGLFLDFQHLLNKEGIYNTNANVISFGVLYKF